MRLWRKLVSVIAGTMIAVGGVVGALAVLDESTTTTSDPTQPASPEWMFNSGSAETAVTSDVGTVSSWLNGTATAGGPHNVSVALDAAVAASAFADAARAATSNTTTGGTVAEPRWLDAGTTGQVAVTDAGTIVNDFDADGSLNGPIGGAQTAENLSDQTDFALALTLTLNAAEKTGQLQTGDLYAFSARTSYTHTPLENASVAVAAASTRTVARLAAVEQPSEIHANWTSAARDELDIRLDTGILTEDTPTLALTSQAVADERPADAAAINAELRSRQDADGSFGQDVEGTAEAARALGASPAEADRLAAAKALDWLDAQGPLPAQDAALRLRAHAVDGALQRPASPPAALDFGGSILPAGGGAKGVLALLFLGGGIGLSLTLVTSDALKGARRRLYDTIRAEPGLHVNELRRRLRMSPSSIEYHLSVLIGAGLVVSEEDGRYKRFYANGAGLGLNPGSPNSRNTLGALRRPHAAEIVQHLLEREDATAREVSRSLGLHESAASRRLDHLEKAGLLDSERVGRERRYRVRERQSAIRALTLVEAPPAEAAPPSDASAGAAPERGPNDGVPAVTP